MYSCPVIQLVLFGDVDLFWVAEQLMHSVLSLIHFFYNEAAQNLEGIKGEGSNSSEFFGFRFFELN